MGYPEASPYNFENQKLKEEVGLINQALFDVSVETTIINSLRGSLTKTSGDLRNMKLFSAFFDFRKIGKEVEKWLDPKYYFEEFIKLNSTNFWHGILAKAAVNGATKDKIPTIAKGLPNIQIANNLSFDHSQIYGLSIQLASMAILRGHQAISDINSCAQYDGSSLNDNLYRAFREIAKTFPFQAKGHRDLMTRLKLMFPYFSKETSMDSILERNGVFQSHSIELSYSPLYRRFIRAYGRVLENEDYKKDMAIRFSPVSPE